MKNLIGFTTLGVFLMLGAWAYAADPAKPGASGGAAGAAQEMGGAKTVKGEVLRIEGENYFVKDEAGKEVKLHVNQQTKKEGDIKVGARVEAQADATGHATSIKAAK
jgi:hypothetical protein